MESLREEMNQQMNALTSALTEKFTQRMEAQMAEQAAHYEERFRSLKGDRVGMSVPEVTTGKALQDAGSPAHIIPRSSADRSQVQVRRSMVKVWTDPNLSTIGTANSFEIVGTSNKPKSKFLSRYLIALLSYGGVQKEYFIDIVNNALRDAHGVFSDRRAALNGMSF
ncbi:hypothetical protein FH972_017869 [Carpinus fangiana]|uniref:RNA-dependent RNA polymerase n=1 Tax=Carpinus fangiana TaxID=176857 RepID=A0A5N6RMA6_9ROSI|nr:hypothetical protein FH972_017869 [Carpinus fangiana]